MDNGPKASPVLRSGLRALRPQPAGQFLPRLLAHACLRCERGGLRRPYLMTTCGIRTSAGIRVCKGSRQPSRLYPICLIPAIVARMKSGEDDVERTQPFSYCRRGQ